MGKPLQITTIALAIILATMIQIQMARAAAEKAEKEAERKAADEAPQCRHRLYPDRRAVQPCASMRPVHGNVHSTAGVARKALRLQGRWERA